MGTALEGLKVVPRPPTLMDERRQVNACPWCLHLIVPTVPKVTGLFFLKYKPHLGCCCQVILPRHQHNDPLSATRV